MVVAVVAAAKYWLLTKTTKKWYNWQQFHISFDQTLLLSNEFWPHHARPQPQTLWPWSWRASTMAHGQCTVFNNYLLHYTFTRLLPGHRNTVIEKGWGGSSMDMPTLAQSDLTWCIFAYHLHVEDLGMRLDLWFVAFSWAVWRSPVCQVLCGE